MWILLVCGVILCLFIKLFFYEDDTLLDLVSSHFTALFSVAKRLEKKLYRGSNAYVCLQIPNADSASRQNFDLLLVTNQGPILICVKNISGYVSADKDGNWLCTDGKHHKSDTIPNPLIFHFLFN